MLGIADDGLAKPLESVSHGLETASGGEVEHGEASSEVQKSKNLSFMGVQAMRPNPRVR